MVLTKSNPLLDAKLALKILNNSKQYSDDYIVLRREFFNKWQKPFVFPTSITVDFFENVVYFLSCGLYLTAKSDYEKNFNAWLNIARGIK